MASESSAASPRWGNGGGSCTCSGYTRPGEPAVFDNSRCPVHAKPLPEASSAASYPASRKCGLWGCGKSATTPVTIIHPEAGAKEIVVCDYHSMMVRDAAPMHERQKARRIVDRVLPPMPPSRYPRFSDWPDA